MTTPARMPEVGFGKARCRSLRNEANAIRVYNLARVCFCFSDEIVMSAIKQYIPIKSGATIKHAQ